MPAKGPIKTLAGVIVERARGPVDYDRRSGTPPLSALQSAVLQHTKNVSDATVHSFVVGFDAVADETAVLE